ncbi:MAG: lysophospholipid acyltransferase family protein [Betaproteobacteria bacterium]
MSRVVLGFLWLVQFLPFRAVRSIGEASGAVLFWLIPERRRVTRTNIDKCFPQLPASERERLARAAFRNFVRGVFERAIAWWAPRERVARLVRLEGLEHLPQGPTIVFAPHFVGFDATITRLSMERPLAVMYAKQKDPAFDRVLLEGRARFGCRMFPRFHGGRRALEEIRGGAALYYLPDLDYGPKHSVFVPFFGLSAATVTGLSYIARSTSASVVPCVTRMLPGGGYVAQLYPAWTGFPSGDDTADARRMMAFVEERVREMPEQYHWLHKRFKTRPAGEPRFY